MTPYQRRYGTLVPNPITPPNDVVTTLLRRVSNRKFNGKPLAPGLLELLIAAAQSAPTSGMLQTWSVIALTTPEEKAKLFNGPGHMNVIGGVDSQNTIAINTSAVVLIWLADLSRLELILKTVDTDDLIKAQVTKAEYHLKAIIDATIAAQTFFMAAESMGITGTYCGAIRQLPISALETEFNLPKHTFPIFGTIHGYNDDAVLAHVRPRMPSNLVLHHGSYTKMQDTNELKDYNIAHRRNGSPHCSNFEDRVIERLAPSLSKEAVGDALRYMGFDFK